jgi:hypothetical protein
MGFLGGWKLWDNSWKYMEISWENGETQHGFNGPVVFFWGKSLETAW